MSNLAQAAARSAAPTLHPSVMLDEELLEFVPGAVYVCDLDGVVVRYNRRAGELWGRYPTPGDPTELYCGSHKLYRDGAVMPHDQTPMVDALRNGTSYRNLEVQVEQPSGRIIWILVNIDPLLDTGGKIVGVINCFQDITDRKLADERRSVLVNELNHRVKNTLATIQAIAAYTFRAGADVNASKWFEGRLIALSRAHDILTRENWQGADLGDIVAEVVAPLCAVAEERFQCAGPRVHLSPKLAITMATALHELCTNAAKYGALSNPSGKIKITWSVTGEGADRRVKFRWAESNGPPVTPPPRTRLRHSDHRANAHSRAQCTGESRISVDRRCLRSRLAARGMTNDSYQVLVVEDEDIVSMLTEDMLSDLGYNVKESAASLQSGLRAAADESFDIALLDINLRGEMSYPIADVLIERGIPFIFTSGYAAQGIDSRYCKAPALQKPFSIESLERLLSRILDKRIMEDS